MAKPPFANNPFLFVGRPVMDEHGRLIGRIASFMVSPHGQVNGVFIEHGDGEFFRYSTNQLKISADGITLLSPIKLKVRALCSDIPLLWRKDQALRDLLEKKKISPDMFNELHKNFEDMLNRLKADAKRVLDDINRQIGKCSQQIRDLKSALVCLEIEREIGKVDEKSYRAAMEMVQRGLKWASAERKDLEAVRNKLSNILLGENATTTPEAPTAPTAPTPTEMKKAPPTVQTSVTLPEPPVIVRVKE